ncbi:HAD family hydrolase, partial [Singulisphaera rosea]
MPSSYIVDMDGVIYHGNRLIPGALDFLGRLQAGKHPFLFLTNNSQWTPRDLRHKLDQMGIGVEESAFHTSALATADFLRLQKPGGTAYVIGGAGLTHALYSVGFTLTEHNPDYVVVGDTRSYDFEKIERAIRLILGGARFVATNLDLTGPSEQGI